MNLGCELSFHAFTQLLSLFKDIRLRKMKAFMLRRGLRHPRSYTVESRSRNEHRDRREVLQKISRMSDGYFKRYFRMDRETFHDLLGTIRSRITRSLLE
jgi:hypothetical protein